MAQANTNTTTRSPPGSSRRRFLTIAGAASAVGAGTLAALAVTPPTTAAQCFAADDSELLQLEKEIFAARDAAAVYDDELIRLCGIWQAEMSRLDDEVYAGRSDLTSMERWALVTAMPESKEHDRLVKLQRPHSARLDALTEKMFSIPATTEEGRRAKVSVLLGTLMEDDWLCADDDSDYPIRLARQLLLEFVGGKSGEQLRAEFA
jgi:hypothetical protein